MARQILFSPGWTASQSSLIQLLFRSVIYGEAGRWFPYLGCCEKCHSKYGSPFMSLFFLNFYWRRVALQCCQFLPYGKVNQLYVYIFALFFGFPSQISHHKALNRVPCPVQWVQIIVSFIHILFSFPFSISPSTVIAASHGRHLFNFLRNLHFFPPHGDWMKCAFLNEKNQNWWDPLGVKLP